MSLVRLRPRDLSAALAADGTSLQFQVQVHVPTGTLAGVEAFVRWPHPQLGMVGPQEIVALVIEGALYEEFDRWVIRTASAQAAAWVREGVPLPLVAVNIWDQTVRNADLLGLVAGTERLEIEMPRAVALDQALVSGLRARGVRVASDGLPLGVDVDTVKLRPPLSPELVRAAKQRGIRVVAEAVETAEQRDAVLAAGCEIVQGYVFGPEVSASEVGALAHG
jgi:EAL domain-containing protein (putative c-di-GMP-specific phosphodiesterase class I)